jgi:hypothetical protein
MSNGLTAKLTLARTVARLSRLRGGGAAKEAGEVLVGRD